MYIKVGTTWYELNVASSIDEVKVTDLDQDKVQKALNAPGRFDPLHKHVNTKSIGSRISTSDTKNIIAAYTQAMKPGADYIAYDKAKKAWGTYKGTLKKDFQDLTARLVSKNITKQQYLHQSRILFKAGYEKAYRLGTDASGLAHIALPPEDLKWLARARSSEYKFLDKFADDIVTGRGSMVYNDRAAMYVDTVDSIFDAGRVDAYPNEGTKIFWELSASENCGDCIDLAMNSPYTPETLPTTPRAGGTRCLSNCGCHLRIRYDKSANVPLTVKPASANVAKALGVLTVAAMAKALSQGVAASNTVSKDTDVGIGDVDADYGYDYESVERLDWNCLDEMVSALATLRLLEEEAPSKSKYNRTRTELDNFTVASKRLPVWLGPFDRDVYVWHAIGTWVLDYANGMRKGVNFSAEEEVG